MVQPVGDLDEDDPDVLGHGHEHLPQVFHLLVLVAGELHPGQLGDPLHDVRHVRAELPGDVLVGERRVLDAVVEQSGRHRVHVQLQVRHDAGHRQRVGDVGGAVLAELPHMGLVGEVEGLGQKR